MQILGSLHLTYGSFCATRSCTCAACVRKAENPIVQTLSKHLHQSVTSAAVLPGSLLTAAGIVVHVLRGTTVAAVRRSLSINLPRLLPLLLRPDEADAVFDELEIIMMKVQDGWSALTFS